MVDRREFLTGMVGVAALTVLGGAPAAAAGPIAAENARPGTTAWRLSNPAGDALDRLGGYARQDSVATGQTLELCVLVPRATTVSARVFRLGWYGGQRGRLVRDLGTASVAASPPLSTRADTGETDNRTSPAFTLTVPTDWVSGLYVVRLVDAAGFDAHITFVVRDARRADLVFSQPILTYAAYTNTPTPLGKSLYDDQSGGAPTSRGTQRATEISLDRPYRNSGSGDLFRWDHDLASWLEKRGYDVTYVTNLDVQRSAGTLRRGKVAVISGHDEYWTQAIMNAYLAARDAGVHIANVGANGAYWRVRLGASRDGRPNRRVICWKYAPGETTTPATVLFKDTATTMQNLWGVDFMDYNDFDAGPYAPIVPVSSTHWFWAGTGVADDQPLPSPMMGYEVDRRKFGLPLPANTEYTLLASSPFQGQEFGRNWAHSVIYRAPSGSWVFSGGTTSWAWGLMRPGVAHPAIERATDNLLVRMIGGGGGQPPTLPAPAGLRSTFQDRSSVVLNYGTVAGAARYEIERDGASVGNSTTGWFTDRGRTPGTGYRYRVRAVAADGTPGSWSTSITVVTAGSTLAAPAGLRSTFQDRRTVVLNYGLVAGAARYEIHRNGALAGTSLNGWYTDAGRTAGTTYRYQVRAVAENGTPGAFTAELSVTTRP